MTRYILERYIIEVALASTQSHPEELVPLSPQVFHILLSLTDQERHGYGIIKEVEQRTQGRVRLGPGTLYGSIKRLLANRLIAESDQRPDPELDDERRRYYRLTAHGRRVAAAEAERLLRLVQQAREKQILRGESGHDTA